MFKLVRNQKGQSLVEFALLLPILILLLLCIMEGGLIFASYLELENAARDGARYASIKYKLDITNISDVNTWVTSDLRPRINERFNLINDPTKLTLEFYTEPYKSNSSKNDPDKQEYAEIILQYPLDIITPIIKDIIGDPFILRTRMVMKLE